MRATPQERLLRRVSVDGNGCWLWTGHINHNGYGTLWYLGKTTRAHRLSHEVHVGPIPTGLQIDHLCRVRRCVNPAHLETVTSRENVLRGISPTAFNATKSHCKNGHPFTGENLLAVQRPGGVFTRGCRMCRTASKLRERGRYPQPHPGEER